MLVEWRDIQPDTLRNSDAIFQFKSSTFVISHFKNIFRLWHFQIQETYYNSDVENLLIFVFDFYKWHRNWEKSIQLLWSQTTNQTDKQASWETKYTHSTHSSVLLSNSWASQLHEINLFIHYWLRRATSHPTTVCGALWTIRWQDETLVHKHGSLSLSEPHTHFHLHSLPKFSRSLFPVSSSFENR